MRKRKSPVADGDIMVLTGGRGGRKTVAISDNVIVKYYALEA